MKSEMQFEETVILLDAAYIDKVTGHLIDHFSKLLDRVLPRAEWALFLETLALDAGLRPEEGKETSERIIQCVIVYDDWSAELNHIVPQDVAGSLDNIASRRVRAQLVQSFRHGRQGGVLLGILEADRRRSRSETIIGCGRRTSLRPPDLRDLARRAGERPNNRVRHESATPTAGDGLGDTRFCRVKSVKNKK